MGNNASKVMDNYKGDPIALPYLFLTSLNKVANSSLALEGTLFENSPKAVNLEKLWGTKRGLSLQIKSVNLSLFEFKGAMHSELVDSTDFNYEIKEDNFSIQASECDEFNGFALRAYVIPKSGTRASLLILLYPQNLSELTQTLDSVSDPRFPGFSLHKGDISLGIATTTLGQDQCGTPILPIIVPGCQIDEEFRPTSHDLKAAMFHLLRTITLPEVKSSHKTLKERWQLLGEQGSSQLKDSQADLIWPEPVPARTASSGNFLHNFHFPVYTLHFPFLVSVEKLFFFFKNFKPENDP